MKRYRADIEKPDSIIVAGQRIIKVHKVNKIFHTNNLRNVCNALKKYGWKINQMKLLNYIKNAPRRR